MPTKPDRPSASAAALLLLFAAGLAPPAAAEASPGAGGRADRPAPHLLHAARPLRGRYLVVLRGPASDVEASARDLARRHAGRVTSTWRRAVRGFSAELSEAEALALAARDEVAFVEEDGELRADGTQPDAGWDLDRIDQRSGPLDGSYSWPTAGAGVHVYVIDSGIRATHSEFAGRASADFTAVDDGHGRDDCNGHGTHVAATVGGATYGVAKQTQLHGVRVLGCDGRGSTSAAISGIEWVVEHHLAPAVANLSLGGAPSAALDLAVQRAVAAGITFVVSAGNDAGDACDASPGRLHQVITVAASDTGDAQAGFSNSGSCVHVYAPGTFIRSASAESDDASMVLSGTSMAAPHVAGAAAMYLSLHPEAKPDEVDAAILDAASEGVLSDVGPGSPNLLLDVASIGPKVAPLAAQGASGPTAEEARPSGGGCATGEGAGGLAASAALVAIAARLARRRRA